MLQNQYRKYLKKVTTKSGNSAHIPKWKYADEMSFVHLNLHAMDAVIHLVDDKLSLLEIRDETDEEEFLQAESECDGTVEQEEQTPASAKNKFRDTNTP